ncbi:MAG TPA: carboxypeptidase regulatory-like domain-containing protein, partial [Bdellovibrionota bacterium]|nr:carboxypeptidase regulatory-like domain-containing protein [Bdellovibrionota bacterium]
MATAFVPTLTPHGDAVKWVGGRKLNLAGNPTNNSGITETFFRDAVVRGLQRWFQASGGAVGFDYWQGTDRSVYEPSSEYNGLSSIYFASQSASGQVPGTEIIGLTQVWYDQDNGNILEADVVLNDVDYVFTQDPTDTSGTGSGKPYSGFDNHVYLENVVTHELGHAMGLSHSGGLQATMLFLESPEQAHLSCDDILGIRAIYGPRSLNPSAGELRGKVLGPSGTPVVGAQVVAVSETRGAAMTYGLTGSDGSYRITALEPGAYSVMVEPYYAGSETLPSYYSTMNANVCGGASFSRTFVTESDGFHLKRLAVPSGSYVNVPDLRVQCNGTRNASVMGPFGAPSTGSAPALENAVSDGGFSVVDRVQTGTAMYYKTTVAGGALQVRTVAYGLYSPVGITLELLDSGLHSVATQSAHPVYSGDSGFNDYDAAVIADNLSPGTYYVKATAQYLSSSRYPAASLAVD